MNLGKVIRELDVAFDEEVLVVPDEQRMQPATPSEHMPADPQTRCERSSRCSGAEAC